MDCGILNNSGTRKVFNEINRRKECQTCINDRAGISSDKKNNELSNLLPGFSSKKISLPIDILVVAESHGGGRPEGFSGKQKSLRVEVKELENYYRTQPLKKFHQNEIRTLLNHLDDLKVTWVFTDLVKCYISKSNGQNFRKAASHCEKYLTKQIDFLKPQVIISLGNFVSKTLTNNRVSKLMHGAVIKKLSPYTIVHSIFPSSRTSDIWVENGGWAEVLKATKKLLN